MWLISFTKSQHFQFENRFTVMFLPEQWTLNRFKVKARYFSPLYVMLNQRLPVYRLLYPFQIILYLWDSDFSLFSIVLASTFRFDYVVHCKELSLENLVRLLFVCQWRLVFAKESLHAAYTELRDNILIV